MCSSLSQAVALNTAATALYMRTSTRAFPDQVLFDDSIAQHFTYVAGQNTDRLEARLRRHIHQPRRILTAITCTGTHHGQRRPNCPYATNHHRRARPPIIDPDAEDRPART